MQVAGVGGAAAGVPAHLLTVESPAQARALARIAATPEVTAPQLALALGLPVAEVDGLVEAYQRALQRLLTAAGFWFPKGAVADPNLSQVGRQPGPTTVLGDPVPGAPPEHKAYSRVAGLRPLPGVSGQAEPAPIFARIALKVGTGDAAVLLLVDDDGIVTGQPPPGVAPRLLQAGTSRGAVILAEVAATPTGATVPAPAAAPGSYDASGIAGPPAATATADQTGQAGASATGSAAAGSGEPAAIPPGLVPPRGRAFGVGAPIESGAGPGGAAGGPPGSGAASGPGAATGPGGAQTAPGTASGPPGGAAAAPGAAAAGQPRPGVPPLVAALTDPVGGYRAWPGTPRAPEPVPPAQLEALARQAAPPVPPASMAAVPSRPAEVHDLLGLVARQPVDLVADARSIPAAIDLAVRDPQSVRRLVVDLTALLTIAMADDLPDPPPSPAPTDIGRVREMLAATTLGAAQREERRRKGSPAAGPGRRSLAEHFFAALFSIRVAEQVGQVEVPIVLVGPEEQQARDLLERVAQELRDAVAVLTDEPEVVVLEIIRER